MGTELSTLYPASKLHSIVVCVVVRTTAVYTTLGLSAAMHLARVRPRVRVRFCANCHSKRVC